MLVEKKSFVIPSLRLQGGAVLKDARLGYETYGTLNEAGDNAILIAHYYSGTSHAAGRYRPTDPEAGYWDGLIGPGKAVDTHRYFVVAADVLCNVNSKNEDVVTTGPASIDPATGAPYGESFPHVTIGDFVETQKFLLEQLGVRHLHAVMGPSMGSMQAMEWAARYPDFVDRAVCVVACSLESNPYLIAMLSSWCAPILLDPDFRAGKVDREGEPLEGLIEALKLVTVTALHPKGVDLIYPRGEVDVDKALRAFAYLRARVADPHSFLRIAKAVQAFSIRDRLDRLRARFLYVPADTDLLMLPEYSKQAVAELRSRGLKAEYAEIIGDGGHLDGVLQVARAGEAIRQFLES